MKPLRANTLKDHANFFLHIGLAAAATTGTFLTLGSPLVLGAVALGITAAVNLGLVGLIKEELQDAIDEERKAGLKDKDTSYLSPSEKADYDYEKSKLAAVKGWVSKFAKLSGLEDIPEVLIISKKSTQEAELEEVRDRIMGTSSDKGFRGFLRKEFNKHANAFAFKHEHGNVVLNNPLVNALDDRELAGVVAHEVGHLAAGHTDKQMTLGWIMTPARVMAGLNKIIVNFSSWKNFGLVWGANIITNVAGGLIAGMKGWDPEEDERHKAKLNNYKHYIRAGVTAGLAVMFGAPDLLIATGISFATREATNFVQKRYSRRNEFHADRLAGELTGDPEGLSRGLEKIRTLHLKAEPGFNHDHEAKEKGWLSSLFGRIKDLQATHPNVDRRTERLRSMSFAEPAWQPS